MTNQEKIEKLDSDRIAYIQSKISVKDYLTLKRNIHEDLPKLNACWYWYVQVWLDFKERREAVLTGSFNDDYDYSNHGQLPYTVAEVLTEIG